MCKMQIEFIRVASDYFEVITITDNIKGHTTKRRFMRPRTVTSLIHEFGAEFWYKTIDKATKKYDTFINVPDNTKTYKQVFGSCYNIYHPMAHKASLDATNCPETLNFLKHIFGEQLETGIDYIKLLYEKPKQRLPILCLVSEENGTGKSTFTKFLKDIFTHSMAIVSGDDIENNYTSCFADKLIVACEESFFNTSKNSSLIKTINSSDKIKFNAKGLSRMELDCFIKFVLTSCNEDNFLIAKKEDKNIWVRKLTTPTNPKENLINLLAEEIPNFLNYLNKRTLVNTNESMFYFSPEVIHTSALTKLIKGNKTKL
ncbi:MAG TPA: primase-helicase family protein [Bacteroidia bacterium]